ncbi:MAG: hypothetical protein CMP23_13340, partial [Rickettsiales bacterium]|nr:hypothetical protein [Rickettsiales bacterium]
SVDIADDSLPLVPDWGDAAEHTAADELAELDGQLHEAFPSAEEIDEPEAEGLIVAPEVVTGHVGELILVEVLLSNDEIGELRPLSLPEEVVFQAWSGGASVEWVPQPRHIGQHDFVFLVVDALEPDLVLAQQTVLVNVLPRFSLIEYGF